MKKKKKKLRRSSQNILIYLEGAKHGRGGDILPLSNEDLCNLSSIISILEENKPFIIDLTR